MSGNPDGKGGAGTQHIRPNDASFAVAVSGKVNEAVSRVVSIEPSLATANVVLQASVVQILPTFGDLDTRTSRMQ